MKQERLPFCSAVIVAGGSSVRFGADKLFADIAGHPVLGRSISVLAACEAIREIVLVVRDAVLLPAKELAATYGAGKVSAVVSGGETRALSALAGVSAVSDKAEIIAIHDGARPLVTEAVILDSLWAAYRHAAAAPAIAVKDTIKIASDSFVASTPDRSSLFAVQTPQVFRAEIIRAALTKAAESGSTVTDDCSAAEAIGAKICLTQGLEENIKITTPLDLEIAEAILRRRKL